MIKPAVQYAAHDFRNFISTLFGTEKSGRSLVEPLLVTRRPALIVPILKTINSSMINALLFLPLCWTIFVR